MPEHRRRQHLDDRRGVEPPEEERHAEPGHPLGPQLVDRDDEVEPGEDRAEAEDERPRASSAMTAVLVVVLYGV